MTQFPYQILFRKDQYTEDEFEICRKFFHTIEFRTDAWAGYDVIGRFSVLPFYAELEQDLLRKGARLINSYSQHRYISEMQWLEHVGADTFDTWNDLANVPDSAYPIVIKGRTNSRKHQWNTHMFAETKERAIEIRGELWQDPLISPQRLVYRRFVPLETYEIGIAGLPFSNEWRVFYYKGHMVDYGYYWSLLDDLSKIDSDLFWREGMPFANRIAAEIAEHTNFFVLDVARDQTGRWWLVEVNDGQMSGLSMIEPENFYRRLHRVIGW